MLSKNGDKSHFFCLRVETGMGRGIQMSYFVKNSVVVLLVFFL